ncbi:MAG: hypothetical protein ACTS9Y_01270 [Methylophilus sp.]|uniref:hypothetical protein n=1 Tax=Methylophilus sp. TaxID=29541 RepID=UPI003FA00803
MAKSLSTSQINHLRRLIGWVACEIGQSPEELRATLESIAPALAGQEISNDGKKRMVETYEKAKAVPKYVRQAVKALRPVIIGEPGDIIDAYLDKEMALTVRNGKLEK